MALINKKVCIVAVRVYYCLQVGKWSSKNEKIRINNHCPRAYRVRRVTGGDGVMSNYTIEDLRGKYVKTGTPEAEVFLDACEELGVEFVDQREQIGAYDQIALSKHDLACGFLGEEYLANSGRTPFTPKPQWTIHNNDKPLRELSDEQYGKLRRAADAGGAVEIFWNEMWQAVDASLWEEDAICRIRPKSEREVFVERCMDAAGEAGADCDVTFAQAIFDAIQRGDIKAPEVVK